MCIFAFSIEKKMKKVNRSRVERPRLVWGRTLGVACLMALFASCGGGSGRNEISMSGAFALYPLGVQWANAFMQLHPDVHIDVSAGGAGKGMTDVLTDMVDFAMMSREVYEDEFARGAKVYPVAQDAVVCDVNAANPHLQELLDRGITREMCAKIWSATDGLTWGDLLGTADDTPVHVYTRSDACGAAETWANFFGMKQESLQGTAVFGDPGIAAAVQKDPYAIGFNNIAYAYSAETRLPNDGLAIVPIDVDGNGSVEAHERFYDNLDMLMDSIAAGCYPTPPARTLYLVVNRAPRTAVDTAFLRFILTEGQKLNATSGYIPLSSATTASYLESLGATPAGDSASTQL